MHPTRLQDLQLSSAVELSTISKLHINLQNEEEDLVAFAPRLPMLEELSIAAPHLSRLPAGLSGFRQLARLEIELPQLQALPDEICQLTQLKRLYIRNGKLSQLPANIGNCQQLEQLIIEHNKELKELPESLFTCADLRRLHIANCSLQSLSESIGNCRHLSDLIIIKNQLQSLPQSILTLENLETLQLENNQLRSLPPFWQAALPYLNILHLHGNPLAEFPYEVLEMKQLLHWQLTDDPTAPVNDDFWVQDFKKYAKTPEERKSFFLLYRDFPNPPSEKLPRTHLWSALQMTVYIQMRPLISELLAALDAVDFYAQLPSKDASFAVVGELQNKEPDLEIALIYHQLKYHIKPTEKTDYIILANSFHKKYLPKFYPKTSLLIYEKQLSDLWLALDKKEEQDWNARPLAAKTPIAFVGNFAFSRTELKTKIMAQGFVYQAKIMPDTQIAVLGRGIKKAELQAIVNSGLPYLREDILYRKLEAMQPAPSAAVLEEKQVETEQIMQLMQSFDESNTAVALAMLDNLGNPKALLTELFCIAKHLKYPTNIRQKARQLVERHGSVVLREKVASRRHFFTAFYSIPYKDFVAHFDFFMKGTELEMPKICHYWNTYFDTGYNTSLIENWVRIVETPELRQHWFAFFLSKKRDWTFVYDHWKDIIDLSQYHDIEYIAISNGQSKESEIPDFVFQQKQVKGLDLSYTQISQLPEKMSQLWALQDLDLSYAPISDLPAFIERMVNLHSIIISNTPFLEKIQNDPASFFSLHYSLEKDKYGYTYCLKRRII